MATLALTFSWYDRAGDIPTGNRFRAEKKTSPISNSRADHHGGHGLGQTMLRRRGNTHPRETISAAVQPADRFRERSKKSNTICSDRTHKQGRTTREFPEQVYDRARVVVLEIQPRPAVRRWSCWRQLSTSSHSTNRVINSALETPGKGGVVPAASSPPPARPVSEWHPPQS